MADIIHSVNSTKKLNELVAKIIAFGERINEIELRPYQINSVSQFVRAVLLEENEGTSTRLWSRKSGKSDSLKVVISALMPIIPDLARTSLAKDFLRLKLYRGGLSVAFAGPKERQAKIPFIRLRRQSKQAVFKDGLESLGVGVVTSNSSQFELSNGSVASAYSGSETASNEGPEASILICDEAAGLSPFSVYKILRPMVAACDGLVIMVGTSSRKKCPFLSDIEFNQRNVPQLHQEIPYTEVIPFSRWYASHIAKEIDRLPGGEENPFFRMNYKLEWLIAEGHFVDPQTFLQLNTGFRGVSGGRITAGVDWGKVGSATTVTILEERGARMAVADLLQVRGEWDDQFGSIIPFLSRYPFSKLYAEENGVGDPLVARLYNRFGRQRVEGKFMSAQYKDHVFTKLDTEIKAKESRFEYFDDGSIESKSFIQQFLDAEQEVRGEQLSVHKSDEEGAEDDFLISTALAADAMLSSSSSASKRGQFRSSPKKRGIVSSLTNF